MTVLTVVPNPQVHSSVSTSVQLSMIEKGDFYSGAKVHRTVKSDFPLSAILLLHSRHYNDFRSQLLYVTNGHYFISI